MIGEPIVTVIGTLGADVELRFTPSGAAVANFSVAVTGRVRDKTTGEYSDGNTTWYRISAWRQMAENVAESLEKGMRVIVTGPLTNREWEDKEGNKRYSLEITADEVGPSLKWASAKVSKIGRSDSGGSVGGGGRPDNDPWASTSAPAPAPAGGGWNTPGSTDQPPF